MNNVHFAIPEIYGDSLSYYELLRKLVDKTNDLIDNYNTVPEQIAEEVKKLDAYSIFTTAMNWLIHSIATDNTKSKDAVRQYKKHDLLYATFNDKVNLYEAITDFTNVFLTELKVGENIREVNISELCIELRKLIDDESQTREQADTTLKQNINAEASAREQADTALQTNIEKLKTYVTPEMFGAKGDGITDDTEAIVNSITYASNTVSKKLNLLNKKYLITTGLELKNVDFYNGTIIYNGTETGNVFTVLENTFLHDLEISVIAHNFSGNVILIDYTRSNIQFDHNFYRLCTLDIKNTETTPVHNSTVIRINYDKYQVISGQVIEDIKFYGAMDYGIYIEPILRNENDNPVYNTTRYCDIMFNSVNCALKVFPRMLSGNVDNAKGGVGLLLVNFSNQHVNFINKPFMDLHNTSIEGYMIIPWDYYDDYIPQDGIYKFHDSSIIMSKEYFPDKINHEEIITLSSSYSTGEQYSQLHSLYMPELRDDAPLRKTGIGWGVNNLKPIVFYPEKNNPYYTKYMGLQLQANNSINPKAYTTQIGIRLDGGTIVYRNYSLDTNEWTDIRRLYGDGIMPTMYAGNRPNGVGVGDMKFDTTKGKPAWWNGSAWVLADGTVIE